MMKMNGAQLIVRLLERQGIRTIAGVPGGTNLPLYDALGQSSQIHHVLARHEQGAGFMAQGMARVSGKAQVCFATSGPGATNTLTALADAKMDSIPVVCITGQVPTALIGTDAFQEVDIYGMSIPITKHNFLVRDAVDLLEVIPEAFRIAESGRPGPVLVDVPKDVQLQMVEFEAWPEPGRPDGKKAIDKTAIGRAAEMINAAQRPILYIGGGVVHGEASDAVRQLAEKASLPVAMTLMALGTLPSNHTLALGMLGMHAAHSTNLALEECDLLIALGARFDDRATGKVACFCPRADIIHIDIDPSELSKIKQAHLAIAADALQAAEALLPLVDENPRKEWIEFIEGLKMMDNRNPKDDPKTPWGLISLVGSLLDDDAVVATDVGQHQMWTAQHYPFRRSRRWLTSGGLGTMGFGLPAAIGAALASPDERPVVCFSGDGSLLMNIQELATAVEEDVNVKVIVLNNQSLGLVRQQQDLFYGKRYFASDYRISVDFVKIAEGFGMQTVDLTNEADPVEALRQAFSMRGPCLIHTRIDADQKVYPMVPPGAANKEMIGAKTHVAE